MTTIQMTAKVLAKIEAITDVYNIAEGTAYLTQTAYPDYDEQSAHCWRASAVVVSKDRQRISVVGKVSWDFDAYIAKQKAAYAAENGYDVDAVSDADAMPEDAGDYPWDQTPDFSAYRAEIWCEDDDELDEVLDHIS